MRNFVKKAFYYPLLTLLVIAFGYSPVFFSTYGMADDFDVLTSFWEINTHMFTFLGSMRPLGGTLADFTYTIIPPEFHNLWLVRSGHVLFVVLFCFLLARTLQSLGLPRRDCYILAMIVGLSPAVQVMVSFSTMMATPLAGIAGVLAFICIHRALSQNKNRFVFIGLGWIALIIGLSIYQVYPMIFWTFVLAEALQTKQPLKAVFKRLLLYGVFFGIGLVLYYFLCGKLIPFLLETSVAERAGLTKKPLDSLIYFIARPLRDSLNLFMLSYYGPLLSAKNYWNFLPSYFSAAGIGGVIVWGLLKHYAQESRSYKTALAMFIFGLLLMSYLPNLIIESLFTPYRTQYALFASITVLLYFSIRSLLPKHNVKFLFVLLGLCFVFCVYHLQNQIIAPRKAEWEFVFAKTQKAVSKNTKNILVVMPDENLIASKTTYYGEFGGMVSMTDRGEEMVQVALRELGEDYESYNISEKRFPADTPAPNSGFIIDMRDLY